MEFADKNAARDSAPILICSELPESNYERMPVENVKDSNLFVQLSYYKVSAPVVALPCTLNQETVRIATEFLQDPVHQHQRFLAIGHAPSAPTLQWLAAQASSSYEVRLLSQSDSIRILEFVPHSKLVAFQSKAGESGPSR